MLMYLTQFGKPEEYVIPGNIIFRQRGTEWFPGENCDIGRDHTIFAKEAGYVRFYRDPHRHPRRRYIGVALERTWKLPTPPNAVRRRRLGMLAVKRKDIDLEALSERQNTDTATSISADLEPPMTNEEKRISLRKNRSGAIPIKDLVMRPGYQWRMTNTEIGQAAERAGGKKWVYKKGDRFLAWRMRRENFKKSSLRRIAQANLKRDRLKAKQKAVSKGNFGKGKGPKRY